MQDSEHSRRNTSRSGLPERILLGQNGCARQSARVFDSLSLFLRGKGKSEVVPRNLRPLFHAEQGALSLKHKGKSDGEFSRIGNCIMAVLFLIAAIHSLVYAIECSCICNNMDEYLQEAYYGRCVNFREYGYGRHNNPHYGFSLDNGLTANGTARDLEECGFDAEFFSQHSDRAMQFAYTKTIRPFSASRRLINIYFEDRWLLTDRVSSLRYEAGSFYFVFTALFLFAGLSLLCVLMPWLSALRRERRKREKRKRKQEKRAKKLEKQKISQKENES